MNKKINSFLIKNEIIIVIGSVWFLFLLFNLYMPTIRYDDLVYFNRLNEMGYLGASIDHYNTWSSRIIIELFLMFLSKHFLVWKLLNSFVMLGTILVLCKYIFQKIEVSTFFIVFSIYCMIPLTLMGETGWRATTLNYQWPVIFALVAFYPFYQIINNKKIDIRIYSSCIPLLIFAANQEQVSVCYFVLTSLLSIYLFLKNKYSFRLLPFSLISLAELAFTLTTPGNTVRSIQEVNRWFPQYKIFSFINKIDLGISSFGKPFFLDANIIFMLLFTLTFIIAYSRTKNFYLRMASAFPLFLNLIIFFGNTMTQSFLNVAGNSSAMVWNSANLDKMFQKTGTKLAVFYPGTWLSTLLIMALLICLLVGLYISFNDKRKSAFVCLIVLMGVCSRVIMGFSPTVWASGMRTYYILYMISAVIILMLLNELMKSLNRQKLDFLQLSLTVIGICTFVLTVLNKG